MKITLPKGLRGFAYDRVLPVELNTFNVDILLPSIFFRVLSGGRDRGRINNDPTEIRRYIEALAAHPRIQGFSGHEGTRTLERLVRTTLIQTARQGTRRDTEQIQGFTGYNLLTCKPGFPVVGSTQRRVDQLIYRMMRDQFGGEGELRRFFEDIFGKGLSITRGLEIGGCYDGTTELDTLTLFSITFLDGFNNIGVKQRERNDRVVPEACPPIAEAMARDLRRYLQAYHSLMPVEALTYHLRALINFELLIYSGKLFAAVTDLVDSRAVLPAAMNKNAKREPGFTPPQMYFDFTGEPSGPSREMATASVRNWFDLIQRFIRANLTLRQLDRYVRGLRNSRRVREKVEEVLAQDDAGPAYLLSLIKLLDDEEAAREIDASARQDLELIRRENLPPGRESEESDEIDPVLDSITKSVNSDFEAVVLCLFEGQGQKIGERVIKWFHSAGGLTKPYGAIVGSLQGRGRHSWRFAASNDLLSILVQLAAVNLDSWEKEAPSPKPMQLADFLRFLEARFGILVDRPLDGYAGAEYAAAARENLQAMLRRLGQMGVFRDLSDDFTVQRLTPPYASEPEEVGV